MRHKIWWLLAGLLLGALWWFGTPMTGSTGPVMTANDPSPTSRRQTIDGTNSPTSTDAPLKDTIQSDRGKGNAPIAGSDWQEKLLQEMQPHQFSEDPYVEIVSLEYTLGQCRMPEVTERLYVGGGTFFQAQQQVAQSLKQQCRQLRQQYPEFFSHPDHEQLAQAFTPQSHLGKLLKQQKSDGLTPEDHKALSAAILSQSIKERNGATLLDSVFVTRFGSLSNETRAQLLGSRDSEYINQMSSLALMLLSCQFQGGRSCEPTGFYMVAMCSQTPAACGLDFPSWLEASTLPGMRRDIDRLVVHFSQYGH